MHFSVIFYILDVVFVLYVGELKNAFGGKLSNSDILICGGTTPVGQNSDCFHINLPSGLITKKLNHLLESRSTGAYLTIKNVGLWIIGGNDKDSLHSSTSMIADVSQTVYGPTLPGTWTSMCAAQINETSFFIGGK